MRSELRNTQDKYKKIIEVSNATKKYSKDNGIFDINFDVYKGEVFGILGPEGAGKTTIVRALTGFIKLNKGSIRIDGYDAFKDRARINEELGQMHEDVALMENMTGDHFLNFLADMRNMPNMDYADFLIKTFDFDTSSKIKKMSPENKKKLAVVAAYLDNPSICIFDNPFTGLSSSFQQQFNTVIKAEKTKGATTVITSSSLDELSMICDRIAILNDGNIVAIESTDTLLQNKTKVFEIVFINNTEAQRFSKLYRESTVIDNRVIVHVSKNLNELISNITQFNIIDMKLLDLDLYETFEVYFGKRERNFKRSTEDDVYEFLDKLEKRKQEIRELEEKSDNEEDDEIEEGVAENRQIRHKEVKKAPSVKADKVESDVKNTAKVKSADEAGKIPEIKKEADSGDELKINEKTVFDNKNYSDNDFKEENNFENLDDIIVCKEDLEKESEKNSSEDENKKSDVSVEKVQNESRGEDNE